MDHHRVGHRLPVRTVTRAAAVGVASLAAAWGLALALGEGLLAATEVVALAAAASLLVSLTGATLVSRLGQRPLAIHLWMAVITTVLGVAAGVVVASWDMFISPADAKAVLVILVAAGTVGTLTALTMAASLNRAVVTVSEVAASLPQPSAGASLTARIPTRELSTLAFQLSQVADQLQAATRRRQSLEASRRELVAWISHDLRTPLAGIRAMSEALEDKVVSDPHTVGRYYRTILTEVERMSGMVDDLFRLSQMQAGLIDLRVEVVSLGDLVSDALSLAAPTAQANGVDLTGQVSNDLMVSLATPEFLRVLRNLLDNALRHTPPGGQVSVEAAASATEAIVAVRDGCGGIPEADIGRVFDLGYQGDGARSPATGQRGGMGLAIAQGLIEAHGGRILVDNEAQGCCFSVRLPLACPSGVGPTTPARRPRQPAPRSAT